MRATVKGGEVTSAAVLERAFMRLDQAIGQLVRFTADLQLHSTPLVPREPARARSVARALGVAVRQTAAAADRTRREAGRLFRVELRSVASVAQRAAAARRFAVRDRWCAACLGEMRQGLLVAIRRAVYWNTRLARLDPLVFPGFPRVTPPIVVPVWEDLQFHAFEGVLVPIRKAKFDLVILGVRLNFALVSFPHFPGWTPEPKLLVSSGTVRLNGITLHALDSIGPEIGNPVLPRASATPAITFNGYMKIIYATNVPAACRIEYRTVFYPRWSYLPSGGGGGWQDSTPGGNPGGPRRDTPGVGPSYVVAPGTTVFADFPGSWFLPGSAVCAYSVRDDRWRTWVVLICPAATTLVGYWEWSCRFVLHQGPAGVENVTTQPGSGPAGVPRPPNGWPAAPTSGPTSWVPIFVAPAQALADYNAAFP